MKDVIPSQVETLKEIEGKAIVERLKEMQFNRAKTARSLGISLRTFYRRMHKLGLLDEKKDPIKEKLG